MIISIVFKYFLYIIVLIWISLTILFQNKNSRVIILKFIKNDFNIIPIWTLFAPNPISKDFYIVYRDYYINKKTSELKIFQGKYFFVLHERYDKATLTLIFSILKTIKKHNNNIEFLSTTPEFKKLKFILKRTDYTPDIVKRQFSIVDMSKTKDLSKFTPIIVSNIIY